MINVIGLGYIGLPTALMFATHGVEVIGTDLNKELVETLRADKTTFKEEGLDVLFSDALKQALRLPLNTSQPIPILSRFRPLTIRTPKRLIQPMW